MLRANIVAFIKIIIEEGNGDITQQFLLYAKHPSPKRGSRTEQLIEISRVGRLHHRYEWQEAV